jgi:hypothetical protein
LCIDYNRPQSGERRYHTASPRAGPHQPGRIHRVDGEDVRSGLGQRLHHSGIAARAGQYAHVGTELKQGVDNELAEMTGTAGDENGVVHK